MKTSRRVLGFRRSRAIPATSAPAASPDIAALNVITQEMNVPPTIAEEILDQHTCPANEAAPIIRTTIRGEGEIEKAITFP